MIGQTISHYKILSKLGGGGMGVVYRAEDLKLKRPVALKFLPPELTRDEEAKRRFMHEAEAASALQHNNICTIHEIDETPDGRLFIAMDCYDGETLKERIARGPIPIAEAVDIAVQIASGLSKAHGGGMVHRDIKPANIIVTKDGVVKILDFGLAKLAGQTKLTKTGSTLGTVAYMSPEQAKGAEVDARSDIFSLGAVFYEMLAGEVPFPGEHEAAVLYGITSTEPKPLAELQKGLPENLQLIMDKALKKAPAERYQSVLQLRDDLEVMSSELGGGRMAHRPRAARASGATSGFRQKRILAVVAAVVVVGVSASVLLPRLWRPSPGKAAHALAVMDFRDLATPDDPTVSAAITELVNIGLLQEDLVRVVSSDLLHDLRRRLFGSPRGAIEDSQTLEIARQAKATLFLAGTFGQSGANWFVNWRLVDARNGENMGAGHAEGMSDASLANQILAEVIPRVARALGIKATNAATSVQSITTKSPSAYQHYMAGILAAEEGRHDEAIAEFEKAVTQDSTFALALMELSQEEYEYAGEFAASRKYAERAWNLRRNLGVKDRLKLEAWMQAVVTGKYQDAFATYEEMFARWPDDRDVLESLVNGYYFFNRLGDVLTISKRGIELYPDDKSFGLAYQHALETAGRGNEALDAARDYVSRHPNDADAWSALGNRFLSVGLPDSAKTSFSRASMIRPEDWESKYNLALCSYFKGDARSAAVALEALLRHKSWKGGDPLVGASNEYIGLGEIYLEAGQVDEALRCFDRASEYHDAEAQKVLMKMRPTYLIWVGMADEASKWCRAHPDSCGGFSQAFIALALDSTQTVRTILADLRTREGEFGNWARRWIRMIEARLALGEHDPTAALAFLEEMWQFGVKQRCLFDIERRQVIAEAHRMGGRPDKAIQELRELSRIYGGNALCHYQLGKIYEEMKRPADAKKEYTTFLAMWSEADKDLPALLDARKRLAAL